VYILQILQTQLEGLQSEVARLTVCCKGKISGVLDLVLIRDSTKPAGLWTLEWTVDWTLDSITGLLFGLEV